MSLLDDLIAQGGGVYNDPNNGLSYQNFETNGPTGPVESAWSIPTNTQPTQGGAYDYSQVDAQGNPTGTTQMMGGPESSFIKYLPYLMAAVGGAGALGAFGAGAGAAGAEAGVGGAGGTTVGGPMSMGLPAGADLPAFGTDSSGFIGEAPWTATGGGGTMANLGTGASGVAPASSDAAFNSALTGSSGGGGGLFGSGVSGSQFMNGAMGVSGIASGLIGLNNAKQVAANSDPFAQYRPFFGNQLMQLYGNPDLVTKLPGYQAGLTAVERSMASQGYNGSGNMMAALQQYGGNFFNNAIQQLGGLSGANVTPGNGQVAAAGIQSGSIGSIGSGIGNLIKAFGPSLS